MLKSQESRPSLAFAAKMSALQSSVKALRPETRAALAGVVGGGLSTLLLHPLDVVKTRQAVFGSNIKKSQLFSGLSKGICANMLVAASSWGVYFAAFDELKKLARYCKSFDEHGASSTIYAAFGAGVFCNLVTNPLSVVRARMILSQEPSVGVKSQYSSVMKSLSHIINQEGIKGFYKGLIPNLINVSHGTIQFVLYEEMKKAYLAFFTRNSQGKRKLGPHESLGCCVLSKLIATLITYPCQNLRARQQAGNSVASFNVPTTLKGVLKQEGLRGLYSGLFPTLIHVTPNICIVFLVYEFFVGNKNH